MNEPSRALGSDTRENGPDGRMPQHDVPYSHHKTNPLTDLIETEKQFRVTACWRPDELPPAELDTMFRNIEEIYRQNKRFWTKLYKISKSPESAKDLGDTLMIWVDDMEAPYTQYCQHFIKGFDSWPMIEEHETLQQTLIRIAAERNRPVSLDFFFEMPLTRLQYYKKLYMRLLKSTAPGRSDHQLLFSANQRLDILIDMERQARTHIQSGPAILASLPLKQPQHDAISIPPSTPQQPPVSPGFPRNNNFPSSSPGYSLHPELNSEFPSRINWNYGLEELEEQLDMSTVIDLFTKQPKKVKISLRPKSLPFKRDIRLHDNFVVIIQYADGSVMHKAHMFLLTDLLMICRVLTPEEKQRMPHIEFLLLYPPLSGKHLAVRDLNDTKDDLLELFVMKREKIILRAESKIVKDRWFQGFNEIIDFATKASVKPRVNTDPRSLSQDPARTSPLSANDTKRSPKSPISPYVMRDNSNDGGQLLTPPTAQHQLSQPSSPVSSERKIFPSNSDQNMNSPDSRSRLSPPGLAMNNNFNNSTVYPNSLPNTNNPPNLHFQQRSRTPDPPRNAGGQYPGDYKPYPPESSSRRSDPTAAEVHMSPNRQRSNSNSSLASVSSVAATREILYKTPPCKVFIWKESTWKPLTTRENCIIEIRLTTTGKCCWAILLEKSRRMVLNAWILPSTTLRRETPTDFSISCEMGQGKEYYRISTPHPVEADRCMQNIKGNEQNLSPQSQSPRVQFPPQQQQNLSPQSQSPRVQFPPQQQQNLSPQSQSPRVQFPPQQQQNQSPQSQSIRFQLPPQLKQQLPAQPQNVPRLVVPVQPQTPRSSSRSASLAQETAHEIVATVTKIMETKCRVFLQNDHGVWTNLNWGHMKLSIETPAHRKRIVISSDKQQTKIIDAIVWEDGVERVGKTGVAITLANMGIVYMLQMKEEKTAIKAFELMKEKKVKS
ncbi:4206_t:CDS:10 [Ambispora gerdemannii]|uniref:4206_t:CDS:1 n=1 Tax=Ambispora gerdemannii TaxID=144530 RepID=A0A9N8VSY9_9GLOM|nr:4206_t:CDS:10 [Ambispora gerdemannii]